MAAPTAVILHGSSALTLGEEPRITRRSDGFDEGTFLFHGGGSGSLQPNTEVPGYGNMIIQENAQTDYSGDLEHQLRAVGLASGESRLIASEASDSEDGFDTGSETWIVASSSANTLARFGRRHSQYSNLVCVAPRITQGAVARFSTVTLGFKGIKTSNKPAKYKIATMTRDVTRERIIVTLPGGDSRNRHTWNLLMSDPTMQKSYLSMSIPSAISVGQQGVGSVPHFPQAFEFSGLTSSDDDTISYQWPNNIVLAAIEWDEIPGTTICYVTEHYVRRQRVTY